MNVNELTTETKRSIYERQNGMCAITGKKFEDFNDLSEAEFVVVTDNADVSENDIVMVWKQHSVLPKGRLWRYLFPHANFANYGTEEKSKDIKTEIDTVLAILETTPNFRQVSDHIKDITNRLTSIGLPADIRSEYKKLLHNAQNRIVQRLDEAREQTKREWDDNYDTLLPEVNEIVTKVENAKIFKEARIMLRALQDKVKNTALSREQRGEIEKLLDKTFKELNVRQQTYMENFEMECIENYHKLRTLLDEKVQNAFSVDTFAEARDILIEVQNEVKEKVLRRVQKDEFFNFIRKTFDELREKFTDYKRVTEEEAAANYAEVKPKIDEAIAFASDVTIEQVIEARDKLIATQVIIKDAHLTREQKDELFAAIRSVFEGLNAKSDEEREQFEAESAENYNNLVSKLELVIVDIENAIDFRTSGDELNAISSALQLARLNKKHKSHLHKRMRYAFDTLTAMRDEYSRQKYVDRERRLQDTIEIAKEKIERLSRLLEKDRSILAEQQAKLDGLSANDEKTHNNTQQIIKAVQERIEEREKSVSFANKKIVDINKDIEKIKKQIEENEERIANRKNKQKKDAGTPSEQEQQPESKESTPIEE